MDNISANNFTDEWNVWYHHTKDNWAIDGYRKIYNIISLKLKNKYR